MMAQYQNLITFFFFVYFTPLVLQYSIDGNSYILYISCYEQILTKVLLVGAIILSPSSRAYVCNAGDRLELTCNTTESVQQWSLSLKGMSDPTDIAISSTTVVSHRVMINTSRITVTRISGINETPLISMLEISPVTEGLNGTLNITCKLIGSSESMTTTTVHIINPGNNGGILLLSFYNIITDLPIICEHDNTNNYHYLLLNCTTGYHPSSPMVETEQEFRPDNITMSLMWSQEIHDNFQIPVSYRVSQCSTNNGSYTDYG